MYSRKQPGNELRTLGIAAADTVMCARLEKLQVGPIRFILRSRTLSHQKAL